MTTALGVITSANTDAPAPMTTPGAIVTSFEMLAPMPTNTPLPRRTRPAMFAPGPMVTNDPRCTSWLSVAPMLTWQCSPTTTPTVRIAPGAMTAPALIVHDGSTYAAEETTVAKRSPGHVSTSLRRKAGGPTAPTTGSSRVADVGAVMST